MLRREPSAGSLGGALAAVASAASNAARSLGGAPSLPLPAPSPLLPVSVASAGGAAVPTTATAFATAPSVTATVTARVSLTSGAADEAHPLLSKAASLAPQASLQLPPAAATPGRIAPALTGPFAKKALLLLAVCVCGAAALSAGGAAGAARRLAGAAAAQWHRPAASAAAASAAAAAAANGSAAALDAQWGAMPWTAAITGSAWERRRPYVPPGARLPPSDPLLAPLARPAGLETAGLAAAAAAAAANNATRSAATAAVALRSRTPAERAAALGALLGLLDAAVAAAPAPGAAREAYLTALTQLSRGGSFTELPDPFTAVDPPDAGRAACHRLLTAALRLLAGSGRLVVCGAPDATLPAAALAASGKYLVTLEAAPPSGGGGNDGDDAAAAHAAHSALELLRFALSTEPGAVFVSLFGHGVGVSGSGKGGGGGVSSEATFWRDVLRVLLAPLRVPIVVAPQPAPPAKGEAKASVMARARNEALAPFFDAAARARSCPDQDGGGGGAGGPEGGGNELRVSSLDPLPSQTGRQPLGGGGGSGSGSGDAGGKAPVAAAASKEPASPGGSSKSGSSGSKESGTGATAPSAAAAAAATPAAAAAAALTAAAPAPACFGPEWILTIDAGTFFCAGDLQRLAQYEAADVACALRLRGSDGAAATAASSNSTATAEAALGLEPDAAAARDAAGRALRAAPPFMQHKASARRAAAGLPAQATCCGEGVRKVRAAAFAEGLRHRAPSGAGECAAAAPGGGGAKGSGSNDGGKAGDDDDSGAGLALCRDMQALHFGHFVMDPSIRVARSASDTALLQAWRDAGQEQAAARARHDAIERAAAAAKAAQAAKAAAAAAGAEGGATAEGRRLQAAASETQQGKQQKGKQQQSKQQPDTKQQPDKKQQAAPGAARAADDKAAERQRRRDRRLAFASWREVDAAPEYWLRDASPDGAPWPLECCRGGGRGGGGGGGGGSGCAFP